MAGQVLIIIGIYLQQMYYRLPGLTIILVYKAIIMKYFIITLISSISVSYKNDARDAALQVIFYQLCTKHGLTLACNLQIQLTMPFGIRCRMSLHLLYGSAFEGNQEMYRLRKIPAFCAKANSTGFD